MLTTPDTPASSSSAPAAGASSHPPPIIAILPWGDFIEDFLDTIGVSLEEFSSKMTGGWLFGYIEALRLQGIRSTIFCFSRQVEGTVHAVHQGTGAEIVILRGSFVYRKIRERIKDPYGLSVEQMFGATRGLGYQARRLMLPLVPFLATRVTALAREIRRTGCSAILCQEYETPRFDAAVAIGKLLRIPVFATYQGGNWQRSKIERRLRPLTLRRSAGLIIAPSMEATRVRTRYGVAAEKISSIFNPLDLSDWRPGSRSDARRKLGIAESTRVAIWHGRIDIHTKGLDILLKAWQEVCARRCGRDLLLMVVGSGRDAEKFGVDISRLGVTQIHWIRDYVLSRPAMREYLNASDVYVFPSRHEGFAVAPLEAMACGLPVVAASASGISDVFGDGQEYGGIVVPINDAESLAKSLGWLLDDDEAALRLGERARGRAEKAFSVKYVGAQLFDFLQARGALARQTFS
jgi:glycosyltransferase involved in cell wall biosynthesis